MRLIQIRAVDGETIKAGSLLTTSNRGFVVLTDNGSDFNIGIAGEDLHSEYIELANNGTWVNRENV
jgi:hypothetical protein